MTSRRDARRRPSATSPDSLPVALRSRRDPLWADADAVADLAASFRLHLRPGRWQSLEAAPWWARFDAFRDAWCRDNGLMSHDWPNTFVDWARMREAGIDDSSSSRYRLRSSAVGSAR